MWETPWSPKKVFFLFLMRHKLSILDIRQDKTLCLADTKHTVPHCEARWWWYHGGGMLLVSRPRKACKGRR